MNDWAMLAIAVGLSYLLGSVPTGLWLGLRLKKIDIREHGSKNIGATNTLRVLGKALGAATLAGDVLKGLAAVLAVARLAHWEHAPLACGLAAVVGHTLSIFMRFRGGKGVATSCGIFLGLCPIPTVIALSTFAIITALTRIVSLGSVLAATALIIAINAMSHDIVLRGFVSAILLLVIVLHRENLKRIASGTEPRIKPGSATKKDRPDQTDPTDQDSN